MASSVDSPAVARASIHSLPLELIQHIIKLAPPPLHSRTFHERYLILRRLALVNSSWSRFAQLELSRHISLDPKSYVALVKALSESSEPDHAGGTSQRRPREPWELAFRVETVRLKGMERPWLVKRVKGIMEYFPNVLELRVGHLMADPRSADCLGPSAFASSLRVIHLTTTLLTPSSLSPAADVFPNLTELVLENPCNLVKALDFLEYTSFPSLRTLALLSWRSLDPKEHGTRLNSALRHLGPNLHRLAFECSEHFAQERPQDDLYQLEWSDFTSLRHLSITFAEFTFLSLERLPSQLITFRFLESFLCGDEQIYWSLKDPWPPCLGSLQKITLPEWVDISSRTSFSRMCAPKGVALEYRDTSDYD